MRRRPLAPLIAITALLTPLHSSRSQATPAGTEFLLCVPPDAYCQDNLCRVQSATALPDGRFAVGFYESYQLGDEEGCGWHRVGTWADVVDRQGRYVSSCGGSFGSREADRYPEEAVAAAGARGSLLVAWSEITYGASAVYLDRCGPGGFPESLEIDAPSAQSPRIVSNQAGQAVVIWEGCSSCDPPDPSSIEAQAFGSATRPASPVVRIDRVPFTYGGLISAAIDPVGRFVLAWTDSLAPNRPRGILVESFGRDGRTLGPRVEIQEAVAPAAIAVDPGGLVALYRLTSPDGHTLYWLASYAQDGRPNADPRILVDSLTPVRHEGFSRDRHGNLALTWRGREGVRGALFNRDLVPQGAPFELAEPGAGLVTITLSDAGIFLTTRGVAVPGPTPWYEREIVRGQIWRARHDADACVVRGQQLLCDTGNDGGEAELRLAVPAGTSSPPPFLADWDGDGRADPCAYAGGRFACDVARDGQPASSGKIGRAGDRPLLGDLNGDGKAEPCVRRGADFLCDVARDGGATDLTIAFGRPTEVGLLGDPDGDGRDDPCVLRGGFALCDTAHDGAAAELRLDLRPLGAGRTLFGDVDGDGRDEACRFDAGRFVCGVYAIEGGKPRATIEIAFGQPGDLPLLGDLDAF